MLKEEVLELEIIKEIIKEIIELKLWLKTSENRVILISRYLTIKPI